MVGTGSNLTGSKPDHGRSNTSENADRKSVGWKYFFLF